MYVDYMGESKQLIYYYSVKFHLERTTIFVEPLQIWFFLGK